MGLTPSQRLAYKVFGPRAAASKQLDSVDEQLRKAQMTIRGDAYIAHSMMMAIATAAVSLVMLFLLAIVGGAALGLPPVIYVLPLIAAPMFGYVGFIVLLSTPKSNAKKRRKDIELRLPYATNYIAAMASAGVIPADIFGSLARQHIYGEVAKEAAMVFKDLHVHGIDIVTALRRSIDRSPSVKFQELLQGAITTVTSGGDLTNYFKQKASRYQWENRVEQKTFIETMGLMAETYVTAAVAGPLFLIVMIAIMALMSGGDASQLQMITYLMLPVINAGFMFGLKSMIPAV